MKSILWSKFETQLYDALSNEKSGNEWVRKVRQMYVFCRRTNSQVRNIKKTCLPNIGMHIVDHCNLNCRGCQVWSPLSRPWFEELSDYEKDISRLSQLFDQIDEIWIAGGEPLLHPQVQDFLKVTRRILPKSEILINTNGILLPKANEDFWNTCSQNKVYIRMSNYPVNLDVESISDTARSYGVMFAVHPIKFFQNFKINIKGNSDPNKAFNYCKSNFCCHCLKDGRIYPCITAAQSFIFAKHFNLELPLCDNDSIDIHSDVSGKEILKFMQRPIPWCRFCTTDWQTHKWEKSKRALDEWI